MAILKLFSASSSRSPSPASFQNVKITHHIHAFGGIYLPSPSASSAASQPEVPYGGRLEVFLPPGSGRRRVKSIRVGIRTISTLDLGQKRGKEEDVIFERMVELGEGTILEEGSQLSVCFCITKIELMAVSIGPWVYHGHWPHMTGIQRERSSITSLQRWKENPQEEDVELRPLVERFLARQALSPLAQIRLRIHRSLVH